MSMLPRPNDTMPRTQPMDSLAKPHMAILK
jgi:hypothetical protein